MQTARTPLTLSQLLQIRALVKKAAEYGLNATDFNGTIQDLQLEPKFVVETQAVFTIIDMAVSANST